MIYLDDIKKELNDARMAFPNFHSYHEGYAVLKEEVDELWDAIKTKDFDPDQIKKEAIQVAAMALRFLTDCCDEEL